ncbi:MAG: hypothetical protein ACKOZV_06980, partial [Bacteroidota bacterium]
RRSQQRSYQPMALAVGTPRDEQPHYTRATMRDALTALQKTTNIQHNNNKSSQRQQRRSR